MTAFYLTIAAMLALAWFFVLPPLLRREPTSSPGKPGDRAVERDALNLGVLRDQLRELDADLRNGSIDAVAHQSAHQELVQRLAEDTQASAAPRDASISPRQGWSAWVVALSIPAVAAAAYHLAGNPSALDPVALVQAPASSPTASRAGGPPVTAAQIEAMVAKLATRLETEPGDVEGWRMLARSYETLRRFDKAVEAYQHLVSLAPGDADVLVDYAVTLAMQSGQSLSGEPERLINQALAIDPGNLQALALAGSAAFERQDYAKAIKPWRQILALAPPDSDMAGSIAASIAKAEALAAGKTVKK